MHNDSSTTAETVNLKWADLVRHEPRLLRLERLAAAGGGARQWCNITSTLTRLVGWHAEHREISSSTAFEAAVVHLSAVWKGGW